MGVREAHIRALRSIRHQAPCAKRGIEFALSERHGAQLAHEFGHCVELSRLSPDRLKNGSRELAVLRSSESSVLRESAPLTGSGTLVDLSLSAMDIFPGNYRFNLADSTEYLEFRFGEAPAPVPLPPAFGMLMAGLAGLRWFARRRPA